MREIARSRGFLYFVGFVFSFVVASTAYYNSSFIEGVKPGVTAGLWYTVSSIVILVSLFFLPHIGAIFGAERVTQAIVLFVALGLLIMSAAPPSIVPFGFIIYLASSTLFYFGIDLLVEKRSHNSEAGRIRGLYLTLLNMPWVIAPLIGSTALGGSEEFAGLYRFGLFTALFLSMILFVFLGKGEKRNYVVHNIEAFKNAWKITEIRRILFIQFILQFFYAVMVIYTPMYLHEALGISWQKIGLVFLIMLMPFVILEYPLGKLADTKWGEKEILGAGLGVLVLSTIVLGLWISPGIFAVGAILFFTRVGAAAIEVMAETHFFKKVSHHDAAEVSLFRMMYPAAYLIAPLLAASILALGGFPVLYTFLGLLAATGFIFVRQLKDSK